ncbi:MAG: hypothetical protein QG570_662 [Patescibacteria group bacterium]|nr:hypothetical protein [Patescibacteria group bacterium]
MIFKENLSRVLSIVITGALALVAGIGFANSALIPNAPIGSSLKLPEIYNATVNNEFTVPVTVNTNGTSVVAIDFNLNFPKEKLKLSRISPSVTLPTTLTFTPSWSQIVNTANQTGSLSFSVVTFDTTKSALTEPISSTSDLVIVNLVFTPLVVSQAEVSWQYTFGSTLDSNVIAAGETKDILNSVASMLVVTKDLTPTPTPTPTPAPTPVPTLLPGGTQEITNPSFESSLEGWSVSGASVVQTARLGSNAAKLTDSSAYVSQNISSKLKAGVQYNFSAYVKVSKAGTSWGVPTLRLSKYKDLGTSDFGQSLSVNKVESDWQLVNVSKTFTSTELSSGVYIGVRNFGFNGESIVDDFSVTKSAVSPTPVVTPTPTPTPTPTATPTPTPTPTTTPTPSATPMAPSTVTFNGSIVNQDGTQYLSSNTWIGTGENTSTSYTGIRFTGVNIPTNAKIKSAVLEVKASSTQWISVDILIKGDNSGNSAGFSSDSLPASRSLTEANVSYSNNVKWNTGTWNKFDDVSSIVQSIVNRQDWKSGNSLSIITKGTGSAFGRKQINGARLTITYTQ